MKSAIFYLGNQIFLILFDFLKNWYFSSFSIWSRLVISILEKLDHYLALKITLKYFFAPLYQSFDLAGYLLGIFFRGFRVLTALILYAAIILIFVVGYLIWLLIPFFLIYKAFIQNG
ncbi:MAG: hypothetical protein KY053_00860 [Candidatus Liptonbacteria bacterium]|nr:hypothetical protein [Candidatus Liptonbacteria bacterium]